MTQDLMRGILEGIVSLACRQLGIKEDELRIKVGGDMTAGTAVIDWYASMQNSSASVNTVQAKKESLTRRCFGIYQKEKNNPPMLRIIEWSAATDWQEGYRTVWLVPAESMGNRIAMAEKIVASYNELIKVKNEA